MFKLGIKSIRRIPKKNGLTGNNKKRLSKVNRKTGNEVTARLLKCPDLIHNGICYGGCYKKVNHYFNSEHDPGKFLLTFSSHILWQSDFVKTTTEQRL